MGDLGDATTGGASATVRQSGELTNGDGKYAPTGDFIELVQESYFDESGNQPEPPRTPSCHPLKAHPVTPSSKENTPSPLASLKRRDTLSDIHIPTRTSSTGKATFKGRGQKPSNNRMSSMHSQSNPTTPRSYSRAGSSADSITSFATSSTASSIITQTLVPQQPKEDLIDRLSPLLEDDPRSFDLVAPAGPDANKDVFPLEERTDELFSREHLEAIFQNTSSLVRFTSFLSHTRPKSVPILIYYLDALKSLRAINYANAVAEALEPLDGFDFTTVSPRPTVNAVLETKARQAFDVLVQEDLPAYITHVLIQVVSGSIHGRITGNVSPLLRDFSEGLAEVFCLTDPSRPDNPIIFASEEFHRTTQYGVSSSIGRNCRFLQGPRTNEAAVERLQKAIHDAKEVTELVLNYRRDGSPFLNLLWVAPLFDSKGQLRYNIGAQVDVSGLVQEEGTGLDAFQQMLKRKEGKEGKERKDELQELCEMFNNAEIETVRMTGGTMHRKLIEGQDHMTTIHRPKVQLRNSNSGHVEVDVLARPEGRLSSIFKHYLLVRPAPSLRILFTSPSLRVPGILQSRLLDRIGGSSRVRDSLADALLEGKGVTAKIRWLSILSSNPDDEDRVEEGRTRWMHCTPLLGLNGAVGVWMVVLIDDDKNPPNRRYRPAPPVASDISLPSSRAPSPSKLWERLREEEKRSSVNLSIALEKEVRKGEEIGKETGGNGSLLPSPIRLSNQSTQSLPPDGFESTQSLSPSYFGNRSPLRPVPEQHNDSRSPTPTPPAASDLPKKSLERPGTGIGSNSSSSSSGSSGSSTSRGTFTSNSLLIRKVSLTGKRLSLPLLRTSKSSMLRRPNSAVDTWEQYPGSPRLEPRRSVSDQTLSRTHEKGELDGETKTNKSPSGSTTTSRSGSIRKPTPVTPSTPQGRARSSSFYEHLDESTRNLASSVAQEHSVKMGR